MSGLPNGDEVGFLKQLILWMGAALTAVGAWVWNHTNGRISKIENDSSSIKKDTFEHHVKNDERQLKDIHVEMEKHEAHINRIYIKLDTISENISKNHLELTRMIMGKD